MEKMQCQSEVMLREMYAEMNSLLDQTIDLTRGNRVAREQHNHLVRFEFDSINRRFNNLANDYRKKHPTRAQAFLEWLNQQNFKK